jgi:hypothetical protein
MMPSKERIRFETARAGDVVAVLATLDYVRLDCVSSNPEPCRSETYVNTGC